MMIIKMMKRFNGIAYRFWCSTFLIVLAEIICIGGIYLWSQTNQLEKALLTEGKVAANTLASSIGLAMLKGDYAQISPLSYSIVDQPHFQYVMIRDLSGTVVNQKGEILKNKELLVETVPLLYFQEQIGEIEIGLQTDELEEQKRLLYIYTGLVALLFSVVAAITSYVLSGKLIYPLKKLVKATDQMIKGSRNVIVHEEGMNEIQELSASFNLMAETIRNNENVLIAEIDRATKGLTEKIKILELMTSISQSVMENEYSLREVILIILNKVQSYIPADSLMLTLTLESDEQLARLFSLNNDGGLHETIISLKESPILLVFQNRKPVIRKDIYESKLFLKEKVLAGDGLRSWLMFPLISQNKVIGALTLASRQPCYFDTRQIELISPFAEPIIVAVDRAVAYESLKQSAFNDYLTGLPNHCYFMQQLQQTLDNSAHQQTPMAVLLLDLDRFKNINDTLGHGYGDLILKQVAKKLLRCLNSQENIVSRMGGDEFTILIKDLKNVHEVKEIAQRIIELFQQPWALEGYEVPITVSIGIALYPNDGEDAEQLIKRADMAMYKVKVQGKNNYHIYNPVVMDASLDRLSLENDLRKALENEEFMVCYQPKVNVQKGEITGVEALLRWKHRTKGFISPSDFIPIAEETGMITEIGEWVLRTACKQNVHWQNEGFPPLSMSVNLSSRQFLQSNLTEMVTDVLRETGIDPKLLEFEITESMTIDIDHAISVIADLKKLGIKLSVDDFGTGYSSLNYIQQLPIDRLKIDRSFITDMMTNSQNAAIVTAIISMATNLGLQITAEGVESENQVKFLQALLCDEIQGYYFSKPRFPGDLEQQFQELQKTAQQWLFTAPQKTILI